MKKTVKIFVGLGNPGIKYENTRHNIGRAAVLALGEKYNADWKPKRRIYREAPVSISGTSVMLCIPDTYMNNSGEAVRKIAAEYDVAPEDIVAAVDEYNFPVGKIQVKRGGSDGGHNGISSIIRELETDNFCRLRCGIGKNFPPGGMVEYVLSRFADSEIPSVEEMTDRAIKAFEHMARLNFGKASSDINSGKLFAEKSKDKKRRLKKVTVFAGSSNRPEEKFFEDAAKLGRILAENKITVTYGGGSIGLMGTLADAVLDSGGKIIGVIPDFLDKLELGHKGITFMHVTETMAERKKMMLEKTDAVIALPGGIGTFEELSEALTLKQLGQFSAPVIIVNTDGFYDSFIDFIEKAIEDRFMLPVHRDMFRVATGPDEVMRAIDEAPEFGAGK